MDQVAQDLITKIKIYSESLDPCEGWAQDEQPFYYQTMTFRKLIKDGACLECLYLMSNKIDYYCALDKEKEEKRIEKIKKIDHEEKLKNYEIELKKLNRLKKELNI